jgi:hypothetical protein
MLWTMQLGTEHLSKILPPAEKKALRFLSIFSISIRGMSNEAIKWVGKLSRTADSRVNLLPFDRREVDQPARYLSILSMRGWKADCSSLVGDRGSPRYV